MKNNYIIRGCLVLALSFAASGCDNFLDADKDNVYTGDYVASRARLAEGVLLNAYALVPNLIIPGGPNDANGMTDVATDNAVVNTVGNGQGAKFRAAATGGLSALNNPFSCWNNSYQAIAYVNLFLSDFADQTKWSIESPWRDAQTRKRLKGEAHALRAYYYSRLLQAHAGMGASSNELMGVPMVMDTHKDTRERSGYQECLNLVLEDLRIAIELLPDQYGNIQTGGEDYSITDYNDVYGDVLRNRMDARKAKMIRSRVLLQAASEAFNPENDRAKWAAAADAAAEVTDSFGGLGALTADRLEFYLEPQTSTEILWAADPVNVRNWEQNNFPPSLSGDGRTSPTQELVDAFPALNGYPVGHDEADYSPLTPYAARDPRMDKYIIYNGANFKNTQINTIDNIYDAVDRQPGFSTRTGYYMKKWMNPAVSVVTGAGVNAYHAIVYMRYTEAWLNYAEAANRAWGPDNGDTHAYSARDVIARLRSTAGIAQPDGYMASLTDMEEFETLIRNERRIELCFESFRLWDLLRWGDLATLSASVTGTRDGGATFFEVEQRAYPGNAIYGPLPATEVTRGLEQNKGW
jgi:hypothetical protein